MRQSWVLSNPVTYTKTYTVLIYHLTRRQSWSTLQELIALRSKNLEGAYEIHKFNNDARELLARIQVRCGNSLSWIIKFLCLYVLGKGEFHQTWRPWKRYHHCSDTAEKTWSIWAWVRGTWKSSKCLFICMLLRIVLRLFKLLIPPGQRSWYRSYQTGSIIPW